MKSVFFTLLVSLMGVFVLISVLMDCTNVAGMIQESQMGPEVVLPGNTVKPTYQFNFEPPPGNEKTDLTVAIVSPMFRIGSGAAGSTPQGNSIQRESVENRMALEQRIGSIPASGSHPIGHGCRPEHLLETVRQ